MLKLVGQIEAEDLSPSVLSVWSENMSVSW